MRALALKLRILFNPINREITAETGDVLLKRMREEEVRIEALCGGKGQCGKCKVILEKGVVEKISTVPDKFLSEEELRSGYYLACMIKLQSDCVFTIPAESRVERPQILLSALLSYDDVSPSVKKYFVEQSRNKIPLFFSPSLSLVEYHGIKPRLSDELFGRYEGIQNATATATVSRTSGFPEIISFEAGDTRDRMYGLALDIGTTTIVGILVDLKTGDILSQASSLNSQITYGEELVTRIAFSRDPVGLSKLQQSVVQSINSVIKQLLDGKLVGNEEIYDVCVGGNTVMNHLFAGHVVDYLDEANVKVSREPIIKKAVNIGLETNREAYSYCLPNVSRFLGGDAIGDVLAADMHKSEEIGLIVDLGTNGEIIFGNSDWLFSCSCASGPAFEGEGVRHGMRGAAGGIDHVKINPDTFVSEVSVIGGYKPKGIVGSGLIDIVAELYEKGLIDFVGKFIPDVSQLVRKGKWGWEYVILSGEKTGISQDIVITQSDLDYVIDSKAAACGAVTVLMKKLKIGVNDVKNVYLAGAFGNYANLENAVKIGLFPEFPNSRIKPIGNGSLSGAYATLVSDKKRIESGEIAEKMVYIDLILDTEFIEEYSKALYIPGAKEYFPSLNL